MTRTRSMLVALATLLAVIGASPSTIPAGGQAATVEVTVSGQSGTQSFLHRCFEDPDVQVDPAELTVHRTGDLSAALAVNVRYLNAPTPLPNPVTIPAGSASTTMVIEEVPPAVRVWIEALAGDGYAVGEPSTAEVAMGTAIGDPACAFDQSVERWVDVGATPDPVNVANRFDVPLGELTYRTLGTEPPGLVFQRDGSWSGTATTPGRYEFGTRYCRQDRCAGGPTVTVLVFTSGTSPDGPTAPAPVVRTTTATPATPVAASPTFTG